jgi:hypothetical protein
LLADALVRFAAAIIVVVHMRTPLNSDRTEYGQTRI